AFLKTRALEQNYSPVLLRYLLEEGRPKLSAAQHKLALDQIVARFKAEIDVKPSAKVTASLAALAGLVTPGVVGEGISEGAGSVWQSWVDAAILLVKAGYGADASPFLESCLKTNPYPELRSRCAVGFTAANPAQAVTILTGLLDKKNPEDVINASLRLLGDLAGAEGCPTEQRDVAVKEMIARTQGMMNNIFYEAAIDGLERSKDPRAVEPIRKLTGGMNAPEVKRAAKRALLLTFKDPAIVDVLRKDAKGGMMKTEDDKFFAATLLIRAGDDAGYAYAREQLTKKKGGFFASSKEIDYRPSIVQVLADFGGPAAIPVLQAGFALQKPDDWLRAYMAIALLELGDKTGIDDARRALGVSNWTHTRLRAAEGLAKHGDASGVPVLKAMAEDPGFLKKAADVIGGKGIDYDAMRAAIARSLGRMNLPDAVAVLTTLVADKSEDVRLAAAYALARMTNAAALDAYGTAMAQDYGRDGDRARTPEVVAHLLRTASLQFGQDPRTKSLLGQAAKMDLPTVRFLALVASRP
ncbi:MAG: HEAT repeat domain-containing protein, partial [Acidobacteria bacterium]|nr:HEAT repeat domain-containing protein [Acidobacteriota bacterium]